ncbi:MAG: homoserine acetyltransferase [Flavobacteriaceae bacterium]|nr:MAG: homoserine acetyltransferase [Flavobacteriaceae bacterium]
MHQIKYISIPKIVSEKGTTYEEFILSYQLFGRKLHSAPVVLINHALTGNSDVAGTKGWWKSLVGKGKLIDTAKYTIVCFDIPGNGYALKEISFYYDEFSAKDVANLFGLALGELNISSLYAAIGSSLGGGIAWEMAALFPDLIQHLVPVASDWKASDWVLGHNKVQQQILQNSTKPLHDARMMAMLFYRTPASFEQKFKGSKNEAMGMYNVESWLLHHGEKLEQRFSLHAYKTMTHLLSSFNIFKGSESEDAVLNKIQAKVHMVGVDSDLFFVPAHNRKALAVLKEKGIQASYSEINSVHGHDAFLIEFEQLVSILKDVFK